MLEATVALLFRPSQQYGAEVPSDRSIQSSIHQRLLSLGRLWESTSLTLYQLASDDPLPNEPITAQFYPQSGGDSLVTLELDSHLELDQIEKIAEENHMLLSDHFNLLNQARAVSGDRQTLLSIKLLALATFGKCNCRGSALTISLPCARYPGAVHAVSLRN